jgi:hypothetical protein
MASVYDVEDFWADPAKPDNSAEIQAAIDQCAADGGGTVLFSATYPIANAITITANDINLIGTGRNAGLLRTTPGLMLHWDGGAGSVVRGSMADMQVINTAWCSADSHVPVLLKNVVQMYMERCVVLGGYYCMALVGGACADNTFMNNTFSYHTGPAMVYVADSDNGVNGAHSFYRCTLNLGYPVADVTVTAAQFRGARANGMTVARGDIVLVGSHLYQCTVAGTTATTPPDFKVFHGVKIPDGTAEFMLVIHANSNGFLFSTNTYYITARECDVTAPHRAAIRIANEFGGDDPNDIHIEQCTAHGPLTHGVYIEAGKQIYVRSFESWGAVDPTYDRVGVLCADGNDIKIVDCDLHKFKHGVRIGGATSVSVRGTSAVANEVSGIEVDNSAIVFSITDCVLGSTEMWGANKHPYRVGSSCNYYSIMGNRVVGASHPALDGSSGASNRYVAGNI